MREKRWRFEEKVLGRANGVSASSSPEIADDDEERAGEKEPSVNSCFFFLFASLVAVSFVPVLFCPSQRVQSTRSSAMSTWADAKSEARTGEKRARPRLLATMKLHR